MNALARSTKNDPASVMSKKAFGDGPCRDDTLCIVAIATGLPVFITTAHEYYATGLLIPVGIIAGGLLLVVAACARIVPGAHWPSDALGTYAICLSWMAAAAMPRRRKLPDTRPSITHKFSVAGFADMIQSALAAHGATHRLDGKISVKVDIVDAAGKLVETLVN